MVLHENLILSIISMTTDTDILLSLGSCLITTRLLVPVFQESIASKILTGVVTIIPVTILTGAAGCVPCQTVMSMQRAMC